MNHPEPDDESAAPGRGSAPGETPTEPVAAQRKPVRRLFRSADDRVLWGVAGGIGRYFDVDPTIVRIAFAISILFGGLGVVAYLAVALFVPSDEPGGDGRAPVQRSKWLALFAGVLVLVLVLPVFDGGLLFGGLWGLGWVLVGVALLAGAWVVLSDRRPPRSAGRLVLAILAATALVLATLALAIAAGFTTALGYGTVVAGVVIAIGVLIVGLAFRGGAAWLAVPALAIALGCGVATAAEVDLEGGIGDRELRPASFEAIPEAGYSLGLGRLVVDLRGLDWQAGRTLDLDVDAGFAEAIVAVPESVCVEGSARAGGGVAELAGQRGEGVDIATELSPDASNAPRLRVDASVDLGVVAVVNSDTLDLGEARDGEYRGSQVANDAACAAAGPDEASGPEGDRERRR